MYRTPNNQKQGLKLIFTHSSSQQSKAESNLCPSTNEWINNIDIRWNFLLPLERGKL